MDHFLGDEFLPLFSTMRKSHVLRPDFKTDHARNRIFYAKDLHSFNRAMGPNGGFCHNPLNFNSLLMSLEVALEPQAYWGKDLLWGAPDHRPPGQVMPEACFRNGVVVKGQPAPANDAMQYAASTLLPGHLEASLPTTTTVIERGSTRRILNMDEVVALLRDMQFPNINVVHMERNTTVEQLQIVRCSGLLVGAFGAALAWSSALNPGAFLVEFLWPTLPPRYIYSCKEASTKPNDKASWGRCTSRYGARAGYVRMTKGYPNSAHDAIGGNAAKKMDVRVDIAALRSLLSEAYPPVASQRETKSFCAGPLKAR